MSNNKKPRPQKRGLSDKELIEKYEAGEINMGEAIHEMLEKPSKAAGKSEKQTKKKSL
jgi:hypothetical protein